MSLRAVVIATDVRVLIREQVEYIARQSPANALAWQDRVDAAIDGLADAPPHPVDDVATARMGRPVRKMVFERTDLVHYELVVFYEIDKANEVAHVIGFRHGARRPRHGEP